MRFTHSSVRVIQIPEVLTAWDERMFLRELEDCVKAEHPCLVVDCSAVQKMDRFVVHLLLSCLEEAMKRNGDTRLCGVTPDGQAALEAMGAGRLFTAFNSVMEAVSSFLGSQADAGLYKDTDSEAFESPSEFRATAPGL